MTVEAAPDPAHPAGHALIRVEGAASAADAPGFRLHRPGWTECNLGPEGWQVSEALLQPDRAAPEADDLLLHVGPRVCAHMEAGSYLFALPAAGVEDVVVWPDVAYIPPPPPEPTQPAPPHPVPLGAAAPPDLVSSPSCRVAPPASSPPPAAQPARRLRWPVLAAVALLLIAGAGGGWYALHLRSGPTSAPRVDRTPPHPEPTPPAPRANLSVPDFLDRAQNLPAITEEGERRLESDRKDDGLLLLEVAAERGDGRARSVLARLYDPNVSRPGGPILAPDARQAARYYRDAASIGAEGVAEPRAALRAMLERRAENGDLSAQLTLKDFWP